MFRINTEGYDGFRVDIEIYSKFGRGQWAQARYLVHGIDDILWTNEKDQALKYLEDELDRLKILAPIKN